MDNFSQTIISQYANSPSMVLWIKSFNDAIDPSTNIDLFYDDLWNIDTAVGYGLDVWGRIVGVSRVLQIAGTEFIGFEQANDNSGSSQPFDQGIWYSGSAVTSNYALTDDAFRQLILAKAAANITDGSITSLNAILMTLFSSYGNIWVRDNNDMTMTVCYDWEISSVQATIIEATGVLPRSSGVAVNYSYVATS